MQSTKTGRPRRYDFQQLPGMRNPEVGSAISALRELAERVYDQIYDLPPEALDYAPSGTFLSIGRLALHLACAEATWMARLKSTTIAPDLVRRLDAGQLKHFDKPPGPSGTADKLISLCRRVQQEVTLPAAALLENMDDAVPGENAPPTVKGVLMPLAWHWTYHSGHIGLLRLEWGSDYVWTFAQNV